MNLTSAKSSITRAIKRAMSSTEIDVNPMTILGEKVKVEIHPPKKGKEEARVYIDCAARGVRALAHADFESASEASAALVAEFEGDEVKASKASEALGVKREEARVRRAKRLAVKRGEGSQAIAL